VRPLYKALNFSKIGNQVAFSTFKENAQFYHPIARKMIACDFKNGPEEVFTKEKRADSFVRTAMIVGGVAFIAALVFTRRK